MGSGKWVFAASLAFCIGTVSASASASAHAEGPELRISGTRVVFSAKDKASSITLRGGVAAPTSFQVRAFRWEQQGDRDVLTPTEDIAVSPPLGTIEPGKSQTVRVVLRNNDRTREQTYRILIDQVPSAIAPPPSAKSEIAVNFRMSVPVIVTARQPSASDVQWSFARDRSMFFLSAENRGARYAMVPTLAVRASNGEPLEVRAPGLPYILSGATRRWRIISPKAGLNAGDRLAISGQLDGVAFEREVIVSAAP